MTLSPTVTEWAEAYEQEHGHKPADLVLQIAEHILKVGKMLTERGRKDALDSVQPYPSVFFQMLAAKAFQLSESHETTQAISDLWQSDYMDGYNDT